MSHYTKIILREAPLLEITFDNQIIHIVDFKNEKNNATIYYDELQNIAFIKGIIKVTSVSKHLEIEVSEPNISDAENLVSEVKRLIKSKDILYPKNNYKQESFESFKQRYNGYGKFLFTVLKNEKPNLFNKLKFYQKISEKEDSFAEYIENTNAFVIHLDFYSELILIYNNEKHIEFGTWDKHEIEKSINFILKELV